MIALVRQGKVRAPGAAGKPAGELTTELKPGLPPFVVDDLAIMPVHGVTHPQANGLGKRFLGGKAAGQIPTGALGMGLYPQPFTEVMHSSVDELLRHISVSKIQ